jgi:hypothetical protein
VKTIGAPASTSLADPSTDTMEHFSVVCADVEQATDIANTVAKKRDRLIIKLLINDQLA